jgi:hypothetical protein
MTKMTLGEFRLLVRKLINEYVANDTPYNANKKSHPDPSAATWDQGMDQDTAPLVGMDESDEDHSETHGGKKVGDARWDDHADPTAKSWDTGLE